MGGGFRKHLVHPPTLGSPTKVHPPRFAHQNTGFTHQNRTVHPTKTPGSPTKTPGSPTKTPAKTPSSPTKIGPSRRTHLKGVVTLPYSSTLRPPNQGRCPTLPSYPFRSFHSPTLPCPPLPALPCPLPTLLPFPTFHSPTLPRETDLRAHQPVWAHQTRHESHFGPPKQPNLPPKALPYPPKTPPYRSVTFPTLPQPTRGTRARGSGAGGVEGVRAQVPHPTLA